MAVLSCCLEDTDEGGGGERHEGRSKKLVIQLLFSLVLLGGGIGVGVACTLHLLTPASSLSALAGAAGCGQAQADAGGLQLSLSLSRPPTLRHNMSDEELLWRASFSFSSNRNRASRLALASIPKVAFLFLTRGPLPLSPLWERFFRGHRGFYSIYIHSNPGLAVDFPSTSVFHGRQIPSQETQWGEMTICDAERRLLANALLDFANERFILVSDSCIPLYAFPIVYKYLTLSRESFVSAFDDPGPTGKGRYNNNFEPLITYNQWLKGFQWFEVNRELAILIVSDILYYPKFHDFCRPPCYPDEHYITNMLARESSGLLANRSLTWVDWSRGGAHPATYEREDINEGLLEGMRQFGKCSSNGHMGAICILFARKFSPMALEPLLQLSSNILGF